MTELLKLFEALCPEVEAELKPKLSGILTRAFIRPYLPQYWVFKTESETVTFIVDKDGNASVVPEAGENPDVTVEIDHEYLTSALSTRSKPESPPEKYIENFHTKKGETAFNLLKKRMGL